MKKISYFTIPELFVLLAICGFLVLAFTGCAGQMPSLAGKTRLNLQFEDVVDATQDANGNVIVPGQRTTFSNKSSLPAGVEAAELARLDYLWRPDNSGEIHISGNKDTSTQSQVDAIQAVNAQTLAAMSASLAKLLDSLGPILGQVRPLIEHAIDAKVQGGQIKADALTHATDAIIGSTPR